MKIASAWSTQSDENRAAIEAYEILLEELQGVPQLMLVHSSCDYNNKRLIKRLGELAPDVPLQGGTSCQGVMTESGFHGRDGLGLGILGVLDPGGSYGAGIAETKGGTELAVTSALDSALADSGRPGELPSAVIISDYPGEEERVISAIEKHIGFKVPIIGGTSADNDMSGQWQQFGNRTVCREAVSVATLFPTGEVGYAFHSGYEPTSHRGRVTRSEGRILYEIDGKPAAKVYNEWAGGLIKDVLPGGGSLVPAASFSPLGRLVSQVRGISYYTLSYPVEVLKDQAILLYTDIYQMEEVVLMTGTSDSLVTRAGRVADVAVEAADFNEKEVEGALVLFCAGCMLSIPDQLNEVIQGLQTSLNHAPFLGTFTLGEQGCFIGGENRHGNLMIAVLVFGPLKAE